MDREKYPCLFKKIPSHPQLHGSLLPVAGHHFFSVQIHDISSLAMSYIIYHSPGSLWTLKRSPWRPKSCGAPKDREAFMTLLRTLQDKARMVPPGKGRLHVK